jgi:hypothetical protein
MRLGSVLSGMPDDKSGREKQARDADRRQRERDIDAELERGDEPEPPEETAGPDDFESELEPVEFPAAGADIVATVGDREVELDEGRYTVAELVPETDGETFDSPDAVRALVRRPTVAAAMKRIVEASETLPNVEFSWSQRRAYETTFRELEAIDPDDDEPIRAISDWIVERIHDDGTLPGSRDVRRQASKFCRANGYRIRNDEWLGI